MTPWHHSPEARALLAQLIADRPEPRWLKRYFGVNTLYPRFDHPAARELRKLHEAALEAAMDAGDHEAFRAISSAQPDDIVLAALQEAEDALTECRGDPLKDLAA